MARQLRSAAGILLLCAYPPAAHYAAAHAAPPLSWLPYLPPVAINLLLCWLFGRTLAPGREPLIALFARMEQGELDARLARYTRCLTGVWTGFFALMALACVALAVFAPLWLWSLFANVLNYLLAALLFVGEYAWRRLRLRRYRHASLPQLVRNIVASDAFRPGRGASR